ncbi:MAG: biotin carboxylase N-terminal domain-containing protein [Paracoccaceae bacterium]|jgi:3-methylcrotonyl-CoA carboxylase alpha subunit
MFRKILIANRGEIACRVIDTARRMGVATVAVFSDADRMARHVEMADEAVHIGGAAPKDSYLRGDAIIAAAVATGAEAIHPGYGFLSENPEFVDAVEAAGLTFIGPSAKAIRAMGLKDAAKKLMEAAGVPVVPGYHGAEQGLAQLRDEAGRIGYPVLIKAVAGGGGKGMRLVTADGEFADALASAQGEAQTAFGNPAVLIEKYVEKPRHIEVQVFGDGTRAVHLFERDCSLQRRHQKVIEEAPAPGMSTEMRQAMGQAAVRAAEAIGYSGAGTIEFIVDGSDGLKVDRFWFMEMNTRLQVEHPVSEAITGVDLVEWQLRVASGESLPARQEDLQITGHAFEARLYAEDVPAGFLPATGRLEHLRFPSAARIETGVREGDVISPWYDPMIAKIVVHGPTRSAALASLSGALAATEVAGCVTNVAFLEALSRHEGFAQGDVDTGLIARDLGQLVVAAEPSAEVKALAAVCALGLETSKDPAAGFSLWQPLRRLAQLDGFEAEVECLAAGRFRVFLEGQSLSVEHRGGWWVDGRKLAVRLVRAAHRVSVFADQAHHFALVDALARTSTGPASGMTLSPMPGLVKALFVSQGDEVAEGQKLAVLEAMKMEHTLTAARAGRVAEVLVEAGAQVEAGSALIRLEDEA